MIEAGSVLFIFLVCVTIFVVSRVHARSRDPAAHRAHLQEQIARLERQLAKAREHNWDAAMQDGIRSQLEHAGREWEKLGAARSSSPADARPPPNR